MITVGRTATLILKKTSLWEKVLLLIKLVVIYLIVYFSILGYSFKSILLAGKSHFTKCILEVCLSLLVFFFHNVFYEVYGNKIKMFG